MPADENAVRTTIETQGRRLDWVAAQMGISQSYLTLLLNGKRRWSPQLQSKVASALGVPEEQLFFRPPRRKTDDESSEWNMKEEATE